MYKRQEDESLLALDTIQVTYDNRFCKHIELFTHYNQFVTEEGQYLINEDSTGPGTANNYFLVEDQYGVSDNNEFTPIFDLWESTHWHLRGEDGSHIWNEDGTRMLLEFGSIKAPLVELETEHYDTMGWHLRGESDEYVEYEDGTYALIEQTALGDATDNHIEKIVFDLYETQYWHLLQEDGITHTELEDGTRLLTENVNIKPTELEAMSGSVIRLGKQIGVQTPIHNYLYSILLPHKDGVSGEE